MKNLILILTTLAIFSTLTVDAQKFYTRDGQISFFSSTPVEDIKADNYQVSSVLNSEGGAIVFSVLMKGFEFEKALMQEHFNEKYVESDEYPKATFKGAIADWENVSMEEDGEVEVTVNGSLNMHGVSNKVEQKGTLTIKDGAVVAAKSVFNIVLEDYEIKIPALVRENIGEEVEVTVEMEYKIYGN